MISGSASTGIWAMNNTEKERIAVLAGSPADPEGLYAAGCDEVILAYDGLSLAAVRKAQQILHGTGWMLNAVFFEDEKGQVQKVLAQLQAGTGSIYFSDPALCAWADEYGMTDRLVYRPDTLAVSALDLLWWMKQGIRSVCVSPLLTLEEILAIGDACPDCEVTVHGHLPMSFSRRPLLSSFGAQKGRFDYTLQEETRQEHYPAYEDERGTLIYTDYVQCSFTEILQMREHGIHCFFIDGSFLGEEELMDAVRGYRTVLDGADPRKVEEEYRKKYRSVLSSGYYREKTIE